MMDFSYQNLSNQMTQMGKRLRFLIKHSNHMIKPEEIKVFYPQKVYDDDIDSEGKEQLFFFMEDSLQIVSYEESESLNEKTAHFIKYNYDDFDHLSLRIIDKGFPQSILKIRLKNGHELVLDNTVDCHHNWSEDIGKHIKNIYCFLS